MSCKKVLKIYFVKSNQIFGFKLQIFLCCSGNNTQYKAVDLANNVVETAKAVVKKMPALLFLPK
jgi:hypothetical protein